MTSPDVPAQLESALDELDMAHNTLTIALDHAQHSTVHSASTGAIRCILAHNAESMRRLQRLLTLLRRPARHTKH